MKLQPRIILFVFLFCYSIIYARWQNAPISDLDSQVRVGLYGDAWSSRNVHSASMWFKDMGFRETKALPVHEYKGNLNREGLQVYKHYPPLPDILGGIYARILNTKDARILAIVPILLSMFFFFFLFVALKNIIPDSTAASYSWLLAVTSCYFICWADDLHQHLYTEILKWVYVWILFKLYNAPQKSWMVVSLCSIFFIQSLLTFESILFLSIVTVGFSFVYKKTIFTKLNFLLLLMPILGVALHLLQNYLFFESWEAVYLDMKQSLFQRTIGSVNEKEIHETLTFKNIAYFWSYELWFRIGRAFTLPFACIFFFTALAMYHYYKYYRKLFQLSLVFLAAGMVWYIVMIQHSYIHTFTIKHLAVFMFFTTGMGIHLFIQMIQLAWQNKYYSFLLFAFAITAYSVYGILYNQLYYVTLKMGLAYPSLGTDAHLW